MGNIKLPNKNRIIRIRKIANKDPGEVGKPFLDMQKVIDNHRILSKNEHLTTWLSRLKLLRGVSHSSRTFWGHFRKRKRLGGYLRCEEINNGRDLIGKIDAR